MSPEQLTSLLPPIVLAMGAILPFLIASPPFSVAANARILLVCVMTLVIWLGYWSAYVLGDWAFFSLGFTMSLIVASLLVFGWVFHVAQKPGKSRLDAGGKPVLKPDGTPETDAPIDQPGWLWLYLAGLILVSVASALYIGPKDRVIVQIDLASAQDKLHRRIEKVGLNNDKGEWIFVEPHQTKHGAELMLTKEELAAVKDFRLTVGVTADGKPAESQFWIAYASDMIDQLKPGLGRHVVVQASWPGHSEHAHSE